METQRVRCVGSTSVRQWPVCGFCWQTPPFVSRAQDENDGLDPGRATLLHLPVHRWCDPQSAYSAPAVV
jgi:hypothetical protein